MRLSVKGFFFLDVLNPAVGLAQVGIVGIPQQVGMETLIRRNRPRTARLLHEASEVTPIPVAGKIAVVDDDRLVWIEQMLGLTHRMDRTERMWRNADDAPRLAARAQRLFHPVSRRVEVFLVADEEEVALAGEHVHHMREDGLAVDLDQRFGRLVAGPPKAFSEAGHRNDDLHPNFYSTRDVRCSASLRR